MKNVISIVLILSVFFVNNCTQKFIGSEDKCSREYLLGLEIEYGQWMWQQGDIWLLQARGGKFICLYVIPHGVFSPLPSMQLTSARKRQIRFLSLRLWRGHSEHKWSG